MSHTVVTTTTTTTTSNSDGGFLNLGYTRSVPGLLKIAQMVALLIAFLCVHCARGWTDWSAFRYFEVVTLWFLIAFLVFFLMYVFRLQSKVTCINWTLTEFLHYAVGTVLVFIASIVAAVKSGGVSELVAGAVFGFIATFLLAVSLWTTYKVSCGSQQTVIEQELNKVVAKRLIV
ncbi:CKLF-like MARVEL transmembrane domain-containing protein 7 [Diretmus argenteus]